MLHLSISNGFDLGLNYVQGIRTMTMQSDENPTGQLKRFASLCARINAAIDVEEFIFFLDYEAEKAIYSGGVWRLLCPIHNENVFRTMIINPRRNTAFCEHTNCAAHTHGDLIELLVKARRLPRAMIVIDIVKHFGAEKLRLTEEQEKFLDSYYVRNAEE